MNCAEVKNLLSAYFDAEASANERAEIADHLDNCVECSREYAGFETLSGMVQELTAPVPPQFGWQQLQEQLDDEPTIAAAEQFTRSDRTSRPSWFGYRAVRAVLAIAAILLVAVGWFALDTWFTPGNHNLLAADFEHYVNEFERNPEVAQQELVSQYEGQRIDLSEAIQRVSYRPAATRLPNEYKLESMYLLSMPCCDCLQTVCLRSDGSKVVIFEYGEEQPVRVGERTGGMAQCCGTNCCLVQISELFSANRKRGDRHVSVVGVRDPAEAENILASIDADPPA